MVGRDHHAWAALGFLLGGCVDVTPPEFGLVDAGVEFPSGEVSIDRPEDPVTSVDVSAEEPTPRALGEACGAPEVCASRHCVGGICCVSDCPDEGAASCGRDGTCDGSGACRLYGSTTACAIAACGAGAATPARTCNGMGACSIVAPTPCAPHVCAGAACGTSCTGPGDCVSDHHCAATKCRPNVFLQDDFNDDAIDTAKWACAVDPLCPLSEVGQELRISPAAVTPDVHYSWCATAALYDFTGARIEARVTGIVGGSGETVLSIQPDAFNRYGLLAGNGSLHCWRVLANVATFLTVPYDPAKVRWRVRHDAAADAVICEAATAAGPFEEVGRYPREFPLTAVYGLMMAGTHEPVVVPGTAVYDDFLMAHE